MLALPPLPAPAPRRQLFVGTALACAAAGDAVRRHARAVAAVPDRGTRRAPTVEWMPRGVNVPEVATNNMLIAFLLIFVFAQWAVYAARRDDRGHTAMALGAGRAHRRRDHQRPGVRLPPDAAVGGERDGSTNTMFYALTGTFVVLMIAGVGFSVVTAFRYLGGRTTRSRDRRRRTPCTGTSWVRCSPRSGSSST